MNSRERVLLALNHKEPDRVPYDMGGTVVTGIQAKAYSRLRKYLGLPEQEIVIIDILQQLAQVDEDVTERLRRLDSPPVHADIIRARVGLRPHFSDDRAVDGDAAFRDERLSGAS